MLRDRARSGNSASSLSRRRVVDTSRDDGLCRGHAERTLQEPDDAPNGNHDEDGDDAPEHYPESFVRVFRPHAPEVLDEPPEEYDDGERDEKPDDTVQYGTDEDKSVAQCLSACDERKKAACCRYCRNRCSFMHRNDFSHKLGYLKLSHHDSEPLVKLNGM